MPVHPRSRSLARWMLKEFRQPLGGAGCEPGRNWPFSIGTRFNVNSHEWVHLAIVPFLSGRRGWEREGRLGTLGTVLEFVCGVCESQGELPVLHIPVP
ncbi:hypothetical protein [Desulfosporosinus shakirovi]|uniref:hypothetical protein n=1 Tax=Desulfosporosinus shakirovi TaxID=2885154 RepID=UPI001E4012E2|nr:hypothetical protein [Desulfosporosinus sp. SRJS8]MCB8815790.1 hypothetical protein [Desulfosporosinus sp. SRJS8]